MLIFEKMFENRLVFTDKLVNMGARIILCDPHRAVVTGPAKLYGQRLSSPDIRAGIALLIASLCAEGTSVIGDVEQIDRGYERIDERLRALGARIERVVGMTLPGLTGRRREPPRLPAARAGLHHLARRCTSWRTRSPPTRSATAARRRWAGSRSTRSRTSIRSARSCS